MLLGVRVSSFLCPGFPARVHHVSQSILSVSVLMPAILLAECLLCCIWTKGTKGLPPESLGFYPQRGEC